MAVQSRYEGPDLEALLEQVRTELGTGTKIVSANKVRSGGVAGFFAKESYEVIVEHDGIVLPAADLAADPTRSVRPRDIAPSLMDLVDQVSSEERAAAPRISTESEPFAAVMERVARDAGIPAAPATEALDDEPQDVTDAEIVVPAPAPVAVAPTPAAAAPAPPAAAPMPATPMPAAAMPAAAMPAAPRPVAAPFAAPAVTAPSHLSSPASQAGALVKMGLPAPLVPAIASPATAEAALRSSLSRLPVAPGMPKGTGSVVAVVGERQAALALARDLSAEAGLDPDAVAIATRKRLPARTPESLVISGSDDAMEKRRSWRRRDRPSVVVIDTDLCADKPAWAYHVLAALEPEATWGVVEATRKTEDVAAWVVGLGGVDALAVNDLDATTSPAAVLQLDVPVGRIDGRTATPSLWAALLTERLAA